MTIKLFLVGEISRGGTLPLDKVQLNIERFKYYEAKLRALGYDVIHEAIMRESEGERVPWETAMKRSILRMLSCDTIYTIPGWQRSRGARLEVFLAGELGIPILTVPLSNQ